MTMNFRDIKDSLITLLGAAAAGRYRTIGHQEQAQGADEVLDTDRSVQVYYASGDFPKSGGSINGPVMHHIMFKIDLTVSKATEGDLSVLENPSATPAEKATALANFQESVKLADDSFDELVEIVYQVLMDARNIDLGMSRVIADRWLDRVQKDEPIDRGQFVVLTGSMQLTCKVDEQVLGDPGSEAGEIMDTELEINEDTITKSGVLVGS